MINNASSAEQAHRNREFQQKMSSTAHQREVADLKKAGLNPLLSAKLGGASTPSGSVAPQSDVISPAVNSGVAARTSVIQSRNIEANTALAAANARKAGVEANNMEQGQELALQAQIAQYRQAINSGQLQENEIKRGKQEILNMEEQLRLIRVNRLNAAKELEFGKLAPYMKPIESAVEAIKKPFKSAEDSIRAKRKSEKETRERSEAQRKEYGF